MNRWRDELNAVKYQLFYVRYLLLTPGQQAKLHRIYPDFFAGTLSDTPVPVKITTSLYYEDMMNLIERSILTQR